MFVPCSVVGLLVPRLIWRQFPLSQDVSALALSREVCASVKVLFDHGTWMLFSFWSVDLEFY